MKRAALLACLYAALIGCATYTDYLSETAVGLGFSALPGAPVSPHDQAGPPASRLSPCRPCGWTQAHGFYGAQAALAAHWRCRL